MYCRHCFKQIEDDSEKCPFCGRIVKEIRIGFDDQTISEHPDPASPDPAPSEESSVNINNIRDYIFCMSCGTKLPQNAAFCSACGTPTGVANKEQSASASVDKITASCPNCGGHHIQYDTVTESRGSGCLTWFLYILLALTILGLLIVIPLMLRKDNEASTYAICLDCGNRWKID